jgi:hypothetical protein
MIVLDFGIRERLGARQVPTRTLAPARAAEGAKGWED